MNLSCPLALRAFVFGLFVSLCIPAAWAGPGTDGKETQPVPSLSAAQIRLRILEGAQKEAARRTPYIMEYQELAYPGGDVPAGTGVCTDLVIRAFRNAGVDLQQRLHEDRVAHPEAYPTKLWEHKKADWNIDHRRCQNLTVWFQRHAQSLTKQTDPAHLDQWQPADVVFFVRPGASHPWHVALIGDRKAPGGMPLLIDSFPPLTSQTHRLDDFVPIFAHFRYDGAQRKTDSARGPVAARPRTRGPQK